MKLTAALLLCALALAGCENPPPRVTRVVYKNFPPKPATGRVEIIYGEPMRPYVGVGEVSVFYYRGVWRPPDPNAVTEALKKAAREMGGDAIIRMSRVADPGQSHRVGQGVVVKWVR